MSGLRLGFALYFQVFSVADTLDTSCITPLSGA